MLILVRHGQRADDLKAQYDGPAFDCDFDPPLTKLGRLQAFLSGLKIKHSWLFPQKLKQISQSQQSQLSPQPKTTDLGQVSGQQTFSSFFNFQKKQQQSAGNEQQQQEFSFSQISSYKKLTQLFKNNISNKQLLYHMQNQDYESQIFDACYNTSQQEFEYSIKNKISTYHTIQIITSPFLRCLQTSVYLAKGMGLQKDQIKLNVNWTLGQYMAPSFFNSWKMEDSPLKGLSISSLEPSALLSSQLDDIVSDIIINDQQKKPDYPEHISQCKNRYRRLIQELMVNNFHGEQNRGKMIIIVSHGHSAEEFMKLFNPTKQLDSVDYCAISQAVKESFKEVDEFPKDVPPAGECGAYGPWRLKITSDARHIGLGKANLIQID